MWNEWPVKGANEHGTEQQLHRTAGPQTASHIRNHSNPLRTFSLIRLNCELLVEVSVPEKPTFYRATAEGLCTCLDVCYLSNYLYSLPFIHLAIQYTEPPGNVRHRKSNLHARSFDFRSELFWVSSAHNPVLGQCSVWSFLSAHTHTRACFTIIVRTSHLHNSL